VLICSKEEKMKISFVALLMLCTALSFAAGCATATCETIEEECGGGDDWIDECVDEYKDGNADCRAALRDFASCVDADGCDQSCESEGEDVDDECD
jgi:hypothetical protein